MVFVTRRYICSLLKNKLVIQYEMNPHNHESLVMIYKVYAGPECSPRMCSAGSHGDDWLGEYLSLQPYALCK